MVLLELVALLCILLLAGFTYQLIGRARDARRYPPRGCLVYTGGRRMHIVESGEGNPAVILESGIAASSVSWSLVQPEVAKLTRVCSYDRAGLGWSDRAGDARTLERSVQDLHSLLAAAGVPPPYVLVGHSYGGLLVRAYGARYPGDVAGLVLVDPVPVGEWSSPSAAQRKMLERGILLSRRGALLARFGLVRFALALLLRGGGGISKLIAKASSGRGESVATRLVTEVSKLPPDCWPLVQSHWCDPKCFLSMADYLEQLPANAAELPKMGETPRVPTIIVSAANSTAEQIAERDGLAAAGGVHIIAGRSGHWIPFDEPELVVDAIRKIIQRHRE